MIFTTVKNVLPGVGPSRAIAPSCGESAARPFEFAGRTSRSQIGLDRPAGFTLLEMMLVLAVLAAMGALAWPMISRAYEGVKLRNAAQQVQAAFNHARVQAMTAGLPQIFHFETNTGNYSVDVWQDGSEDIEATGGSTSTAAGGFSAGTSGSSADGASGTSASACSYKLPDGFVFTASERVLDDRTAAAEAGLSGTGIDTSTPPVLFYPDGTTSEAKVTLANQNSRAISVSIRGLTGLAKVGEITAADAAGGTAQ